MKNTGLRWLIAFSFAVSFVSCEKEITPDHLAFEPKLVVEGYVDYADGQAFPTPTYVILTKSIDFFSKIDSTTFSGIFERKADVRVSDGTNEVKLRELCSDELTPAEIALPDGERQNGKNCQCCTRQCGCHSCATRDGRMSLSESELCFHQFRGWTHDRLQHHAPQKESGCIWVDSGQMQFHTGALAGNYNPYFQSSFWLPPWLAIAEGETVPSLRHIAELFANYTPHAFQYSDFWKYTRWR